MVVLHGIAIDVAWALARAHPLVMAVVFGLTRSSERAAFVSSYHFLASPLYRRDAVDPLAPGTGKEPGVRGKI